MVSKKLTGLFLLFSAGSAMLTAAVVEERFQNTRDFSPALERWMYRGVAGEVIGGAYLFTGVNPSVGLLRDHFSREEASRAIKRATTSE